jgi:protein SCO1/2
MRNKWIIIISSVFILNCAQIKKELPILGNIEILNGDTITHKIPDFSFINQNSEAINNETFSDKIYIVDFFFVSCPTICPKVKQQMLRIYDKFSDQDDVLLLSHTIDPKRDTIARLKKYADALEVKAPKWHFVTGEKNDIYDIADDYFSIALENSDAPGGFDHSGRLILIDKERQVRSFCNGTDAKEVTRFMKDIESLLKSYEDL